MSRTLKIRFALAFLATAGVIALTLVYWNHFDNTFHFDDLHTIKDNVFITDIRNLSLFFTDSTTSSSLPTNQAYRPVIACLNAIDYWIGGGLDPTVFHLHIFIEFLILLGLLFWLFHIIFESASGKNHPFVALAGTAFFAFHTATAETLNYIIARSDGFSTLMVLVGLLVFLSNSGWKRQLGLLPFIIGCLAKLTTLMLAPLLALYYVLVKAPSLTVRQEGAKWPAKCSEAATATASYFFVGAGLYFFTRAMTPDTWTPGGASISHYLNTQPYVLWVYVKTFFLPTGLTADTDLTIIKEYFAPKVLWGLLVIGILLAAAWLSARRRMTLPIAYGILWFFVCLIPTSTIIPLAEVMNHHRTFFPYIGLTMAVIWGGFLLFQKLVGDAPSVPAKTGAAVVFLAIIALHAYGVYQRNEVWHSAETLWFDVTVKSPNNGRGLMNYGLTKMHAGDIDAALDYFNRARNTSYGNHPYLLVNLGIATNVLAERSGDATLGAKVEEYLKTAVRLGPGYPLTHYYYADWLHKKGRSVEALGHAQKAIELGPAHEPARKLRQRITLATSSDTSEATGSTPAPTGTHSEVARLLNASVLYYKKGEFEACMEASTRAAELDSSSARAFNNVGICAGQLGLLDEAIQNLQEALRIDPSLQLAQNNLAWVKQQAAVQ